MGFEMVWFLTGRAIVMVQTIQNLDIFVWILMVFDWIMSIFQYFQDLNISDAIQNPDHLQTDIFSNHLKSGRFQIADPHCIKY